MKNRRNYYRVLQVQPDAPLEVIRASYKALMRDLKQHPDLGGDLWNAQVLNEAYATLSDRQKRQTYDKKLYERYTRQPFRDPVTNAPPLITMFCSFCKRPMAREAKPLESCPTCKSPLRSQNSTDLENECRRTLPRIKKSAKFNFYTTWPQKGMDAELVDISKHGLRFYTNEIIAPGKLIKISSGYLRGVAKIKNTHRVHKKGSALYSVGAEFVSVTFGESRGGFYSSTA